MEDLMKDILMLKVIQNPYLQEKDPGEEIREKVDQEKTDLIVNIDQNATPQGTEIEAENIQGEITDTKEVEMMEHTIAGNIKILAEGVGPTDETILTKGVGPIDKKGIHTEEEKKIPPETETFPEPEDLKVSTGGSALKEALQMR